MKKESPYIQLFTSPNSFYVFDVNRNELLELDEGSYAYLRDPADIQHYMDEYGKTCESMVIDYIHGDEHLLNVAKENNAVAVFMPCLEKSGLFDYVVRRGVLPRKSFSMGHAEDKRYYLECRSLI